MRTAAATITTVTKLEKNLGKFFNGREPDEISTAHFTSSFEFYFHTQSFYFYFVLLTGRRRRRRRIVVAAGKLEQWSHKLMALLSDNL